MTLRLFFHSDDLEANVEVLDCTPHENEFSVTLPATPFHPQGGGQPFDTGWIGETQALRVTQESHRIVHYVTHPVTRGTREIGFGELPAYGCGGTHVRRLQELGSVKIATLSQKKGTLSVHYSVD